MWHADGLHAAVFDGYIAGLLEAGWHGAVELVRLGSRAAIALRWRVLAGILNMLVHFAEPLRTSQGANIGRRRHSSSDGAPQAGAGRRGRADDSRYVGRSLAVRGPRVDDGRRWQHCSGVARWRHAGR